MAAITVELDSTDIFSSGGFVLQSVNRPSGTLRVPGVTLPGIDGYHPQIPVPSAREAVSMALQGKVRGSTDALRQVLFASEDWVTLEFSDQAPKLYMVKILGVDEQGDRGQPGTQDVTINCVVSPPCLLGPETIDATSPVANPGTRICPAEWTIAAADNFALTVGAVSCVWTGGAGTVVIDSGTFEVTKDGVPSPQHLRGGYPWLLPGDNVVGLTAGSTFSCKFNPRYA